MNEAYDQLKSNGKMTEDANDVEQSLLVLLRSGVPRSVETAQATIDLANDKGYQMKGLPSLPPQSEATSTSGQLAANTPSSRYTGNIAKVAPSPQETIEQDPKVAEHVSVDIVSSPLVCI